MGKTLDRHPTLCFGVLDKHNSPEAEAKLYHLPSINWDDVVETHHPDCEEESEDEELAKQIGVAHEHLFTDQRGRPAWRIMVLTYRSADEESQRSRFDVIFSGHHAITDGTSCAAFHRTLFHFMNEASAQKDVQTSWPYIVSDTLVRIPFVEDLLPTPANPTTKQASLASRTPYTFSPPITNTYNSRDLFITIPAPNIPYLLRKCRSLNSTLTSLVHSLIIIHLAKAIPQAQSLRAITPVSLRRFTGISNDEIANHVSGVHNNWDSSLLAAARLAIENTIEENALITEISKQYQSAVIDELTSVPMRGAAMVNAVAQSRDFDVVCEESEERPRSETYEVSNVGVVDMRGEEGEVKCEKLVFTQCGMVCSAAVGCGVISVREGPLVVSLTWQEGVVEEAIMDGLKGYLERRLMMFGRK